MILNQCACLHVCFFMCGLYSSAYCEVAQCALRSGQTPPELKSFSSLAGFQAAPRDAGQCFRQGDTRPVPFPLLPHPPPHPFCSAQLLLNVLCTPCNKSQTSLLQQDDGIAFVLRPNNSYCSHLQHHIKVCPLLHGCLHTLKGQGLDQTWVTLFF